jgi:hypothetical protein
MSRIEEHNVRSTACEKERRQRTRGSGPYHANINELGH